MNKKKLLLIRLDKIGDLICTLGVDQTPEIQNFDRIWVIGNGLGFIADHLKPTAPKYFELNKIQSWSSFKKLIQLIQKEKPDVAVSFQAPWWVNFALFLSRVPQRSGVLSQWHSFLFLNKGLRQKRSQSTQHESQYNQELLCYALDLPFQKSHIVELELKNSSQENTTFLEQKKLRSKNYIVVHPGMAGSALNWPVHKYVEFILSVGQHTHVVLTGTSMDDPWIQPILEQLQKSSLFSQLQLTNLQSQLSPTELLLILKNAISVVGPSTGVIHLAAALGTPVKAIYSPIRVHHPKRWGPQGYGPIDIYLPKNPCPEAFNCAGPKCSDYACMEGVNILNEP
ncbi:MAG TPA: glycosyltransferase family 9 protein [Pseudobdellovibrionaceae bacterium]|nr:glycosyltransferase family 9 protein [Pseudobdellovibrionaceae bacterium]